jgi:hypothetical protein
MTRTIVAVFAAAVATAACLVLIAVYSSQRDQRQSDINKAVCQAVVKLDGAVTDSLKRSLKNLPKIAYYKDHPDELAIQQEQTRETLKEFIPPTECVGSKEGT